MDSTLERHIEADEEDPGGPEAGRDVNRLKPPVRAPSYFEAVIEEDLVTALATSNPPDAGKADATLCQTASSMGFDDCCVCSPPSSVTSVGVTAGEEFGASVDSDPFDLFPLGRTPRSFKPPAIERGASGDDDGCSPLPARPPLRATL